MWEQLPGRGMCLAPCSIKFYGWSDIICSRASHWQQWAIPGSCSGACVQFSSQMLLIPLELAGGGRRWAQVCAFLSCVELEWKSQENCNSDGILGLIPRENCFKIQLFPSSLQFWAVQRSECNKEVNCCENFFLWKGKIGSNPSHCFFWPANRWCKECKGGFKEYLVSGLCVLLQLDRNILSHWAKSYN